MPALWALALLLALSLWTSVGFAQLYNGDGGGETPATQQSTPDTTTSGTMDNSGTTADPTSTGEDNANLESSTPGVPATGAGGLLAGSLTFLAISAAMAGAGALMLRRRPV